jgi:hypothetical protein
MDKAILQPLQTKLLMNNDTTLKGLIRKLKKTLSPTRENAVEKARKDYRNHLTNAGTPETGSCSGKLYTLLQNPIR